MNEKRKINQDTQSWNAWILAIGENTKFDKFSITLEFSSSILNEIQDEDAILLSERHQENSYIIAVARVFHKHITQENITYYFDGIIHLETPHSIEELNIPLPPTTETASRLEWSTFERLLKAVANLDWDSFPTI